MKTTCLLISLLTLCCVAIRSQEKENFSTEVDASYYYYYLNENRINNFNYGFSFLLSYIIDNLKVSSGINFSTKNSYYNVESNISTDFLERRVYRLDYVNIPILISYGINSSGTLRANILSGIIFNKIIGYSITSSYLNKNPVIEKNIKSDQKTGVSLRLGINISKKTNQYFVFNLSPFVDYKFELDYTIQRPDYRNLTDDRLTLGIKLGIEYVFNMNK